MASPRPSAPTTLRRFLVALAAVTFIAAMTAVVPTAASNKPVGCDSVPSGARYVARSGSDSSGNGSSGSPWATISHAVNAAPSGSTIVVRAGTYREEVEIRGKQLTLMAAPGETVWLSGSDVVTGWVRDGNTWRATPANGGGRDERDYFDGKKMLDSSNRIAGHLAIVFIDGAPQVQVGSVDDVGPGEFAVSSGVYHLGSDPTGKRVSVGHRDTALFIDDASNSKIIGIGVKHYVTPPVYDGAVRIATDSRNVVLRDMSIVHNANVGIQARGINTQLLDNTVAYNGRMGISANNADDLLVRGNHIHHNNNARFAPNAAAAGIKVTASRRVAIDANHSADNYSSGIWLDRSNLGIDVTRNKSENNERHGVHVEVSAQIRVVSNTSVGDTVSIKVGDSNDVDIFNNVLAPTEQAIRAIDGPRDSSTGEGGGFGLPHDSRYSFPIPGILWEIENLFVRNNVSVGGAGNDPMLYVNDSTGDAYGNEMASASHNIYHRGLNGNPTYIAGWSNGPDPYHRYQNLSQFQSAHGQGNGSSQSSGSTISTLQNYPTDLRPDGAAPGNGASLPNRVASVVNYTADKAPIGLLHNPSQFAYGHCVADADGGGGSGSGGTNDDGSDTSSGSGGTNDDGSDTSSGSGGTNDDGSDTVFVDVPESAFYAEPVSWLVESGATTGTSPTTFSPEKVITRGEAAAFFHRLAGEPRPDTNASAVFRDVPSGVFYTKPVGWLIDEGATTGTSPTTFSPSRSITRGEAATFMHRLAGTPAAGPDASTAFSDVPSGVFYAEAVGWLIETGATTGTSPTTFSPSRPITRGEFATLLHRLNESGVLV